MIFALIIGLIVGYVLAIPPGPIGMAAIRTGIRQGFAAAFKLAIGAGLFDFLYCTIAMIATSAVVDALTEMEKDSPMLTLAIQLAVVVAMIIFGIVTFREQVPVKSIEIEQEPELEKNKRTIFEYFKNHGPFFVGVGFALANLANPTFVPSLAATATFVQKLGFFDNTMVNNVVFALGFGIGNMAWLATLVKLILMFKDRMNSSFLKRIQQVSGVTLVGFGAFYGILVVITKWAQISRVLFAL